MSVLVYAIVAASFHEDIVLSIDRYHRNLAQHIHNILGFRTFVGLHIVTYAVYLLLYELALSRHSHSIERMSVFC